MKTTLILKMKIKNTELAIGVIYGPNQNSLEFYNGVKNIISNVGVPFI
jgi:hypothetical protein